MDLFSMLNDNVPNSLNTKTKSITTKRDSPKNTTEIQVDIRRTKETLKLYEDTSSVISQRSTPSIPTPISSTNSAYTQPIQGSPLKRKYEDIKSPKMNGGGGGGCYRLGPTVSSNPSLWIPRLSLGLVMKDQPLSLAKREKTNMSTEVFLKADQVIIRGEDPKILLENNLEMQGTYPRGFFVLMMQKQILHNFIFQTPDHPWFEDLYGLRRSAYLNMRTEEGELYELHLKPSRDKKHLFGYLIKHTDMIRIVKDSMSTLLRCRKLPLVLDLDDTLVRLVGEGNERYVKEADVPKCSNRVAVLKDGRRVVLTERVHEFLEWAQNFFDISVCSLGDQTYVDNVVNVLDPQRVWIKGILYSARSEHDYIRKSPFPGRPPKDLLALYSFCALKDKSLGSSYSLPMILDDETRMWPEEQHDNIIEMINQANTPVWSVSLFPVVKDTLQYIHQEFFRQYDSYQLKLQEAEQNGTIFTRCPPSATSIYKTYLRHILRDFIAAKN